MDDFPGLIFVLMGAVTGASTLATLLWAAVLDGRDERAFQRASR